MPEKQLHVELIAHTPIPEQVSALAAKLCYAKADVNALRERISEHDLECIQDLFFAIDVDGLAVDVVEGPNIIQSAGMVHVVVGQEYGIDVGDVLAQHLGAEIRTGVYEYP